MDRGGEPLETYILVSLPKHRTIEQKLKRAEEIIANSFANPPQVSERVVMEEEEEEEEEAPDQVEEEVKSNKDPPVVETSRQPSPPPSVTVGKNQTKAYRKNQIKKILNHLKRVSGSESILQLDNLDDLIHNALSQSRKVLANQEQFYRFMFDSGLSSLVRNRHAISKWYKKNWYFI